MKVISQKGTIKVFIEMFQEFAIKSDSDYKKLQWTFPNGEKVQIDTYNIVTKHGTLKFGIPDEKWNGKVPHLLSFSSKEPIVPEMEINIPIGLDRKVSGVFVKKGNEVLLCTRGHVNSFRGRIKKAEVFSYFKERLVDVDDGDRITKLIVIGVFTSSDFSDQLAQYLTEINELKFWYKNEVA